MKLLATVLGSCALALSNLAFASDGATHAKSQEIQQSAMPADFQQFVKDYDAAVLTRDLDRVMSFYSERYMQNGRNKQEQREFVQAWLGSVTVFETRITHFKPTTPDHAFIGAAIKVALGPFEKETIKTPDYQVVKENGQWRWAGYGK